MRRRHTSTNSTRATAGLTAAALAISQLVFSAPTSAAPLGSSTASAGSTAPPSIATIQSFQPDLFTGRATTSIPLAVPPGRKSVQPSLALAYSSSSQNGWVGVGWGLDAGYIERSTKEGVPTYSDSDTFTFMFQGISSELVRISDGTYRAEDEALFLRFEQKGVSGWRVWDKSGTQYFFGQATASQIQDEGRVFRWALDRVRDTKGNTLTITYMIHQHQLYLNQIQYTGHEPTDLAPTRQVDFLLEDRADIELSLRSGFVVTTAKRLKTVETKVRSDQAFILARRYNLTYMQSARTGRSLLTALTQVGADGLTSLPAMTFTYQEAELPSYGLTHNNPTTSTPAWNVRKASMDFGHENFGCVHPYSGLPWGSQTLISSSGDLGCVNANVSGDGRIQMSGCQDHFGHAWMFVYSSIGRTINVPLSAHEADACVFREDAQGVERMSGSSVSLQAGWSVVHLTAYNQHTGWGADLTAGLSGQVDLVSPSQFLKPQLSGDVDGNGTSDLVAFDATTGTWTVSCARTCTLSPGGAWLSGFGNTATIPLLGDWNSDGLTDIGIYRDGTWEFATSQGERFERGTVSSIQFGSGVPITGDFNGDGRIDIGTFHTGSWSVARAEDSRFIPASSFSRTLGTSSSIPLTGDFNGDGLTDIAVVESGTVSVALSNGSAFVEQPLAWTSGFGGGNYTSADVNGDGLTDVLSYDKGSGQVRYKLSVGTRFGDAGALPISFSLRAPDDGLQVGDFNGDGLSDPAVFNTVTGNAELATSQGSVPDVLKEIQNGMGGSTRLVYQRSSELGSPLPFIIPVVSKVTLADGLGHEYTTTYSYHEGFYDAVSKEFRGFARAEVRDAQANVSITEFHQDEHTKGRPFRTEFRDRFGKVWTKQEQAWSCVEPYPGVHFAKLDQSDSFIYDGDDTIRQTRSQFEYDGYGNVINTFEEGEISKIGDERRSQTDFVYNTRAWILNKPSLTQVLDAHGTVVTQRQFLYDGATIKTSEPTIGNLTKEQEWLNVPTEQWLSTNLTYDEYGNVKTVIDALGRTTINAYDETGTFLTTITNALGHSHRLAYDVRFGQVNRSTDQNDVTTMTEYDALGRIVNVIGPTDTTALPTLHYDYDLSTVPNRTTLRSRMNSGQPAELVVYTFTDGLGRTIQTRSPAEDPSKQIVSGVIELDARGLVVKQSVPYFETSSSSYMPPSLPTPSSLATVTYTYDPLGRPLTVTDPSGSVRTTVYDDWTVTAIDAKGNMTHRTVDVYGRLAMVEEFNGTERYTTIYAYDSLGNLIRVTDHAGHVTDITYDSLSRKIAMDDPDMGQWTYGYDAVDNLVSQTDARGVTMAFTYDALNRLTQKSYAVPSASNIQPTAAVSYAYDNLSELFSKGKLTGITDGSGASSFVYDTLGRLIKEEKVIDGTGYSINRTYDLIGRLTSLTYPTGEQATYTYNLQGGLETVGLESAVTGHSSLISNMDYNAAGQLTRIAYGNGVMTDYSYDPQTLHPTQLSTHNSQLEALQDFSYTFDAVGNVTEITDRIHTGSQTFEYDPLNRLTKASGNYGTFTYAYDPIGNMLEKEGVTMRYGENGGGPHAVTSVGAGLGAGDTGWALTYDPNGNMVKKSPLGPGSELTAQHLMYDAENRLVEVASPQEDTVTLTFQPGWNFFSLPLIPDDSSISALFPTFSQDFEQIARLAQSPEPSTLSPFEHYVSNPKFDDFTELEYGLGYQVYCKATSPVTITFTGRLPTKTSPISLDAGWHLLPASSLKPRALSEVLHGLDYDQALGYETTTHTLQPVTQAEAGRAYFVHLRSPGTFHPALPRDPTTRFVYDGDGGRVKKIAPSGTTTFLGQTLEKNPTGNTTTYIFAGSQRIAAKDSTGEIRFYHGDHLGSSHIITDAAGQLIELTEHTPYGSLSRHEGSTDVPQKFTGQRLDNETDLYFYNARYYDPLLGRFTQPDTFIQTLSDPQTLNRYTYVQNNPVNFIDPSGYFSWKKLLGVVAAVTAIVAGGAFLIAGAASTLAGTGVAATIGLEGWLGSVAAGAINVGTISGTLGAVSGISYAAASLPSGESGRLLNKAGGSITTPELITQTGSSKLILFINGVLTSEERTLQAMSTLDATAGFHNPSIGGLDFISAFMKKFVGSGSRSIEYQLAQILKELGASDGVINANLIAHSEGSIILSDSFFILAATGSHLNAKFSVRFIGPAISEARARASAMVVKIPQGNIQFETNDDDPIFLFQGNVNPKRLFRAGKGLVRGAWNGFVFTGHDIESYAGY